MKNCYFCLSAATGNEHAPPRIMFKGFECDSITVPSCDTHNNEKGERDQAIVHGFFKSLIPYKETLDGDILKAFSLVAKSFNYTKNTAVILNMLKHPIGAFKKLPDLAYLPPDINIRRWIRQLTAAIVYSAILRNDGTINWERIKVESPNWIPANGPGTVEVNDAISYFAAMTKKESSMLNLTWDNGWSAHPRPYPTSIYKFNIHLSSDVIIIKHIFYERYNWFAWIPSSAQLVDKIRGKTPSTH
jgi:hypothetical protein